MKPQRIVFKVFFIILALLTVATPFLTYYSLSLKDWVSGGLGGAVRFLTIFFYCFLDAAFATINLLLFSYFVKTGSKKKIYKTVCFSFLLVPSVCWLTLSWMRSLGTVFSGISGVKIFVDSLFNSLISLFGYTTVFLAPMLYYLVWLGIYLICHIIVSRKAQTS